jgi:hypothetical protein
MTDCCALQQIHGGQDPGTQNFEPYFPRNIRYSLNVNVHLGYKSPQLISCTMLLGGWFTCSLSPGAARAGAQPGAAAAGLGGRGALARAPEDSRGRLLLLLALLLPPRAEVPAGVLGRGVH